MWTDELKAVPAERTGQQSPAPPLEHHRGQQASERESRVEDQAPIAALDRILLRSSTSPRAARPEVQRDNH